MTACLECRNSCPRLSVETKLRAGDESSVPSLAAAMQLMVGHRRQADSSSVIRADACMRSCPINRLHQSSTSVILLVFSRLKDRGEDRA